MGQFRVILILSLVIGHLSFASVRYVSHSGNNTPPYTTWETAADSIMSAINISSFGDTIYVANGLYEEQVVMIPGLSLIGAGMDSCIIDTRMLIDSIGFDAVIMSGESLLQGFKVIVSDDLTRGTGISVSGGDYVTLNRVTSSCIGLFVNSTGSDTSFVYKNKFDTVSIGIWTFNSGPGPILRKNIIYTDSASNYYRKAGIYLYTPDSVSYSLIDSNYILASRAYGIWNDSYHVRAIVRNNTIRLNNSPTGIYLTGILDSTTKVYNNLVIGDPAVYGIRDSYKQKICNNVMINLVGPGLTINGTAKNNLIINCGTGIKKSAAWNHSDIQFNNSWNNGTNYSGFTPDSTNISADPMVVNADKTHAELDFHLQAFSPLIDKGDPAIFDKDGTRSDIGLYGGPFGEMYGYQDLSPRVPVNLSAALDSNYILLKWNKNTETDFSHYDLYRDTTENFTADSTTFVASVADTFYLNIIPENTDNVYFKLTAVDNQGNESEPSEELHVFLTGTINNEEFIINNYRLYQNYPNPFNPYTRIGYRLKERGYVKLYVYDIKGELVETLVNKYQNAGYYKVAFESSGIQHLASGVYIYQIMVRNERDIPVFSDIKKMILLK